MYAALHQNQNQAQLTIRNPHKLIKIKPTGLFDTHIDYYNNYQLIKNKNQEKYKQEQLEQAKQLGMLIRNDQIGSTAFDKLASIMQIKTKHEYWIPDDDNIKNKIIEGFQQLYNDDKIIEDKSIQISEIMLHTIEIIEAKKQLQSIGPLSIPKSKAKDMNGFSQRNIIKFIHDTNLKITVDKFKYLINMMKNNQNAKFFLHNTSKIILKKKKAEIKSYSDLRALAIMPAMVMVFDKILAKIIDSNIKSTLSNNQHGGRQNRNTTTAKIQLAYNINTKGYDKILLIDLRKAFDLVNHEQIIKAIDNKIKDTTDKTILKNILQIYKYININVQQHVIHPTRGVPQGSVFGPTLFLLTIDDIIKTLENNNDIHIQAFVDDIAISSNTTDKLQNAYNIISRSISKNHMEINVDKCELITNNQNITIIDEVTNQPIKTCTHAKYLGQTINNLAETNDIILRRSYNSIAQLIHTSETFITLKSRIKLFKIYIKSKYTHLLPLIAINGNIEKTWSEIRKTIFNDLLKRSTQPKESATLLGCSYYSIIIKPLLKIIDKSSQENNSKDLIQFLKEATKKAFLYWTVAEQNHSQPIIENIKMYVENKKNITINDWD